MTTPDDIDPTIPTSAGRLERDTVVTVTEVTKLDGRPVTLGSITLLPAPDGEYTHAIAYTTETGADERALLTAEHARDILSSRLFDVSDPDVDDAVVQRARAALRQFDAEYPALLDALKEARDE